MELTKINKNKLGPFIAFPRTQLEGLPDITPDDLKEDEFTARAIEFGDEPAWVVEQAEQPRMMFQVFRADNVADFDRQLGILLSMQENPIYVSGHLDALLLFQGNHDHISVTQENYSSILQEVHRTRDRAAYWWQAYGKKQL